MSIGIQYVQMLWSMNLTLRFISCSPSWFPLLWISITFPCFLFFVITGWGFVKIISDCTHKWHFLADWIFYNSVTAEILIHYRNSHVFWIFDYFSWLFFFRSGNHNVKIPSHLFSMTMGILLNNYGLITRTIFSSFLRSTAFRSDSILVCDVHFSQCSQFLIDSFKPMGCCL